MFERDGYIDARVSDITKAARCSTGTFYTYFDSKEAIFHALLESVGDDLLHPGVARQIDPDATPYQVIEASNRAYFEVYQRNAKLMMLIQQVAAVDMHFRRARLRRTHAFVHRNARSIAQLQARGLVDPKLDAHQTARALSAMVSGMAYHTYCLDDEPIPIDKLVDIVTRLWANALRLER